MQGQLRRLYVPCPPLSSVFRPPFRRPFHIGFGRRTEQHAPGAVGAIERVEFARFPARRHFGGLRPSDCGELIDTLHPFTEAVRVHDRGHRIELPWPQTESFPDYGVCRSRKDFDDTLWRKLGDARR